MLLGQPRRVYSSGQLRPAELVEGLHLDHLHDQIQRPRLCQPITLLSVAFLACYIGGVPEALMP